MRTHRHTHTHTDTHTHTVTHTHTHTQQGQLKELVLMLAMRLLPGCADSLPEAEDPDDGCQGQQVRGHPDELVNVVALEEHGRTSCQCVEEAAILTWPIFCSCSGLTLCVCVVCLCVRRMSEQECLP